MSHCSGGSYQLASDPWLSFSAHGRILYAAAEGHCESVFAGAAVAREIIHAAAHVRVAEESVREGNGAA